MSRVLLRDVRASDLVAVARVMTPEDAQECAVHGFLPDEALEVAVLESRGECWTLEVDGRPLFLGGLRDTGGCWGIVWMLGGRLPRGALREAYAIFAERLEVLLRGRERIFNIVPCDRRSSLRMLRRLGFDFEPAPVQYLGREWLRFHMTPSRGRP